MNYLQLCQELVAELGLSGGGANNPAATAGNTIAELNNVTRWIRDSCLWIDNLWIDWKYLWVPYGATAVASTTQNSLGYQALPAPTGSPAPTVQLWDTNKFRWRQNGVTGNVWTTVDYYTRQDLFTQFDPDNAVPGPPAAFTVNPDNSLSFSAPFDVPYDFKGEFWQRPVALVGDDAAPLMPAQYHRIILARSAVMYGNREDAPEIIAGLEAEYIDFLDKLQSDQLEDWEIRRTSTDRKRPARLISLSQYLR